MKKMSIADAANFFGISREAIYNRIRRGSLQIVTEDGVKMVIVDEDKSLKTVQKRVSKSASNDERYYKLLETQNEKLQEKIALLEDETRKLRDHKEQMLIAEREKIERIYKEKDEQLKNILQTLSSKFMLGAPLEVEEAPLEAEMIEVQEIKEIKKEPKSEPLSLKKYLKSLNISKKKSKKIEEKFAKKAAKDKRITIVGSKYYVDPSKYSYKDLIK